MEEVSKRKMKLVNVEDLKVLVAVESKGEIRYGKLVTDLFDDISTTSAIPTDYIWERAEWYEKQWLEEDNHWCKNVAEALRALLEDWDGEQGGGILEKYE